MTAGGAGAGPSRGEAEGDTPAGDATKAIVPRRLAERYQVSYLAGTHVGENAGAGCWQGTSATGSNDCVAIRIGEDESLVSLRLTDDEGVVVGATVYQHAGGEGAELVSFCGSTDGYVAVEPGALLLVYLDTSARCSDERPHTGTLSASMRRRINAAPRSGV